MIVYILTVWLNATPFPLSPQLSEHPTKNQCEWVAAVLIEDLEDKAHKIDFRCTQESKV